MICVSVSSKVGLKEAIEAGAEMLELRLDLIGEAPADLYALIPGGIRTVVTCRPGAYGEGERLKLLQTGIKLGAAYVDLEIERSAADLNKIRSMAKEHGTALIISYHDFERTGDREDLESIMIACYEKGGDIAKIATQVNGHGDIRNLLGLYDLPGRKVILGMGQLGRITRVVGPYLGAEFTFASTGHSAVTAPGQLSLKELNDIFKVINES